jgi:hypothetical protein
VVDTRICLKTAGRRRLVAEGLTDKAQTDLQDAISCINAAADSDRADYLLACAEEFMRCSMAKMRLAIVAARLTPE